MPLDCVVQRLVQVRGVIAFGHHAEPLSHFVMLHSEGAGRFLFSCGRHQAKQFCTLPQWVLTISRLQGDFGGLSRGEFIPTKNFMDNTTFWRAAPTTMSSRLCREVMTPLVDLVLADVVSPWSRARSFCTQRCETRSSRATSLCVRPSTVTAVMTPGHRCERCRGTHVLNSDTASRPACRRSAAGHPRRRDS